MTPKFTQGRAICINNATEIRKNWWGWTYPVIFEICRCTSM